MLARLSLRTRLVLGVLVLAAAGLAVADAATYTSLRSFLIQRVDNTLEADHPESYGHGGPHGPGGRPGGFDRSFTQYRTHDGTTILASYEAQGPSGSTATSPPQLPGTISMKGASQKGFDIVRYFTVSAQDGGDRYRVRAAFEQDDDTMVVTALSLHDVDGTLHRLLMIELLVTGLVLAALGAIGVWVVSLGLRPLRAIEKTAGAIASGDLSQRVERAEERTEVGRLGLALNSMLSQIETAFKAREVSERKLRRFVADASHELRTPLAAVRAYAELFDRGARERPEDLERAMAGIQRESRRMGLLVDDLLLLARLDQGRPLERKPVELGVVAREAVEAARTLDPGREIELDANGAVVVQGDKERLRQVLDNLLANVRAHTPPGSAATVRVTNGGAQAVLEVADSGPGLSSDAFDHAFERFYRGDSSRSRDAGGAGLGLAIAAAIAESHGGKAVVVNEGRDGGTGLTVRVTIPLSLPVAPKPAPAAEAFEAAST